MKDSGKDLLLLFHRVTKMKRGNQSFAPLSNLEVCKEEFEKVASYTSRNFNIASIDEIRYSSSHERVFFTFDDGYLDNLEHALPVLEKYRIPATVYVAGGFVDNVIVPYEFGLEKLISQNNSLSFKTLNNIESQFSLITYTGKHKAYAYLKKIFSHPSQKKVFLQKNPILRKELYNAYDELRSTNMFMSGAQLRMLNKSSLITIGAHTYSHTNLRKIPLKEACLDVYKGAKHLRRVLGNKISHFSYPYGGVKPRMTLFLRGMGFKSAVTTTSPKQKQGKSDRFHLERFEVCSYEEFHNFTNYFFEKSFSKTQK